MENRKILVAGFERFGYRAKSNVSSEVALPAIKERYGDEVETIILPVLRGVAAEILNERIKEIDPATVAIFGMSAGREIRLEERAKNWQYSLTVPDNNGRRALGRIVPGAPLSIDSTLSIDMLQDALVKKGVAVKRSRNAGSFICNEVMYRSLYDSSIPTGFIHIGQGMEESIIETASLAIYDALASAAPN